MNTKQQSYKAFGIWKKKVKEAGGKYTGNVHRDTYQLRVIIEDIGLDELLGAIDYYFKIKKRGHDFLWFLYNYDKLIEARKRRQEDESERERVREQTRKLVEDYNRRFGD